MTAVLLGDSHVHKLMVESHGCAQRFQQQGGCKQVQIYDHSRVNQHKQQVNGAVFSFASEDLIRADSPLLCSPERLFAITTVVRVDNGCLDENTTRRMFPALAETIHTQSPARYDLAGCEKVDSKKWQVQLGKRGFLGLHKQDHTRATPSYYLVAHSDSDYVGEQLVEQFIKPQLGSLTYEGLLSSAAYQNARQYSERNVQRMLADASNHLGLRIQVQDDTKGLLENYDAPPDLAMPTHQAHYNLLHRVSDCEIKFYGRTCHLPSCVGDRVPYMVDPCYGLELYNKDASRMAPGWYNKLHAAFPIGVGRVHPDDARTAYIKEQRRLAAMDAPTRDFMNQVVHWRGRKEGCSALQHDRLFAYYDYSDKRRNLHKGGLGGKHGNIRIVPVGLVLPPPAQ